MANVAEHEAPVRKKMKPSLVETAIGETDHELEITNNGTISESSKKTNYYHFYKGAYYECLYHLRKANKACEKLSAKVKKLKNHESKPRYIEVDFNFDFARYIAEEFIEFNLQKADILLQEATFGRVFRGLLTPKGVEDTPENPAKQIAFVANGVQYANENSARVAITIINTLHEAVENYHQEKNKGSAVNWSSLFQSFPGVICFEHKSRNTQILHSLPVLAINAYKKVKIDIKFK